jgi:diguanylate cyclase (GGDEF)-like protein/putative nucleotidyltransferase with HDIG domain
MKQMIDLLKMNSSNATAAAALALFVLTAFAIYLFGWAALLIVCPLAAAFVWLMMASRKELKMKAAELERVSSIHLATIESLATAIDARDQITVGHVRRTQIYALALGRLLGVSPEEMEALRTGALLHDIGKLAVPDHILNKPGKLTPAELEKTKIHSVVGASILEKIGYDFPVVPTVRHHHECWDGSGYPDGLKGAEIPLTARILTVADAYDTLRGTRPYRPAMPREKARQIMQAEAGTRFDPQIVGILLKHLSALEDEAAAAGLAYEDGQTELSRANEDEFVEQIKRANREVFNLYELAREFSSALTPQQTLELLSRKLREFVPFDTCVLYLLDKTKESAAAVHVYGLHAKRISNMRVRIGKGATGFALKKQEMVSNVDPDLDFFASRPDLTQLYTTMAAVPIRSGDELLGAISIYTRELDSYVEEHLRLFDTIAQIAGDAIDKSLEHNEARMHALTDPLTGLPNARALQEQFEKEVARATRAGSSFQLLMLDLDGFKTVNDNLGHKFGDKLLKEVGKVIKAQLRDYDFLARYGGDEFVALIPDAAGQHLDELCRRIENAVVEFELTVGDAKASVGVSLGGADFPKHGSTFDQLIIAADKAMYLRKMERKAAAGLLISAEPILDVDAPQPLTNSDPHLVVELDDTHVIAK